VHGVLD